MFVVVSLAAWFTALSLFGRYLPASAALTEHSISAYLDGSQPLAQQIGQRRDRAVSTTIPVAPLTTGSIARDQLRKRNKRAIRAELADEIGSWAKIGSRWEWRENKTFPKRKDAQTDNSEKARWSRQDGVWVFEAAGLQGLFRYI